MPDFLGKKIIDTPYVQIDYWSFLHFGAGMLVRGITDKRLVNLLIHLGFEAVENTIMVQQGFVKKERAVDVVWDLVFDVAGWEYMNWLVKR